MREKIKIKNERIEFDEKFVYLCADIELSDRTTKMWYRFPKEYEAYVCVERADAFLTGLLYYAMIYDYDLVIENPISERLLFQLSTYYIPTLAGTTDFFHEINIDAVADVRRISNEGAVGTALSCGVDSFYTILKSLEGNYKNYKVTHVLFTDIPATIFSDQLRVNWLNDNCKKTEKIARELNLKFILCETNLNREFKIKPFYSSSKIYVANEGLASLQYCSSVFALQKLFHIYYLGSAGYKLNEAKINASPYDVLWHDFFSMPNISTENLIFYSSGVEASRIEKINYIADFSIVQKHLFACAMPLAQNCGRCEKCTRTMAELYALKKLDKFEKVYPVDEFKKQYTKRIAVILSHRKKPFNRDILKALIDNGYRIPFLSYPLSLGVQFEGWLREKLRDNMMLRNIYFKLKLDVKKYGMSTKQLRENDLSLKRGKDGKK